MLDPDCDTLPKHLFRNAAAAPDGVAMRRKTLGIWQPITWRDYATQVSRIAAGLLALELGKEQCLAAIGDNEPELFWVELAVQATGRAITCQFPDITADELLVNLRDCGARIVFAEDQEQSDKLLSIASDADLRLVVCWDALGMDDYDHPLLITLDDLMRRGDVLLASHPSIIGDRVANGRADDLAVIIYTSGTTSRPKGVMGSHRYLLDISDRWRSVLEAEPGASYVSYISPAWATEQYIGISLGVSLPLLVNFPEEPETVPQDLREIGPRFQFFGSRQWESVVSSTEARMQDASPLMRRVYRAAMASLASARGRSGPVAAFQRAVGNVLVGRAIRDRLGFTHLKTAVNSGSTLSPEVFAFFHALGIDLRNVYGFTEIGIVTATREDDPYDTLGRKLTSRYGETPLDLRISEDEIQVRGGAIFAGYLNAPDATAERFTSDGWVRSGDAGILDPSGRLIYLDRLEDIRRLASGETIAPQGIETRLRLSPYIRDVIVVCAGRPAPGALVDIDIEMVGRWSEEQRISFTSQVDLSQHPSVRDLIRRELVAVNGGLPERHRIERFVNLLKPFDADEGELTRSRKLRRGVVEGKYADLIDALYGPLGATEVSVEIRYQDGRSRQLKARVSIEQVSGSRELEPHGPGAGRTAAEPIRRASGAP